MEKVTLEDVVQRLDRLEKMVVGVNEQLSWLIEKLVPDVPKDCEVASATKTTNTQDTQNDKRDDDIGTKVIQEILERMGYPPDFKPRPLKEVRKGMVESGIRPEDNEFSRAIIAEREK